MNAIPTYQWRFASSSGSGHHETLQYTNGTLTCSCPGWTKRCVNGIRTCKHVRFVQTGVANQEAATHGPVGAHPLAAPVPVPVMARPVTVKKPKNRSAFERKFV